MSRRTWALALYGVPLSYAQMLSLPPNSTP